MSGGGKSKSSSSTSTTTQDNRGVADNGSLVVSGSSNAQVTFTDQGAVDGALNTVKNAIDFVSESGNSLVKANQENFGKLLDAGLKVLDSGQKNIATTASTLGAAYEDAKGGNTNNQYIAMLGIGAAVAVAYAFSRKG